MTAPSRPGRRSGFAVPSAAAALTAGIVTPIFLLDLYLLILPWAGDDAPYAPSLVAVVVATLLAGWRSGAVAILVGQSLAWLFVVEPRLPRNGAADARHSLILATVAALLVLAVLAFHQQRVARAAAAQRRRIDLLGHALREIDHRTLNNYHTTLSLILLQSNRTPQPEAKAALTRAAERVRAVALASRQLGLFGQAVARVRLHDCLRDLCGQIEAGMAGEGVRVEHDLAEIIVPASWASSIAIVVNELATNALKHAFDGQGGTIRVTTRLCADNFELEVSDDGNGMGSARLGRGDGLGMRLVHAFVGDLNGKHHVRTGPEGTTHRVRIPGLGRSLRARIFRRPAAAPPADRHLPQRLPRPR